MSSTDLCPWLGLDQDRETRYATPTEAHLCYAQKRTDNIKIDYQTQFCLTGEHKNCHRFREPAEASPHPAAPSENTTDKANTPRTRSPWPWPRLILWGVVIGAVLVAIAYYGSALLSPLPLATATLTSFPNPSPTPTPNPGTVPISPSPTYGFAERTATPTPFPGGAIYSLSPRVGMAGWVSSDESRGNHLGDSYLYAGVVNDTIYHGVFQLDLPPMLRGTTLHAATLEITGLDTRRLADSGVWEIRILAPNADSEWRRLTYQDAHNARVQWTLSPALNFDDLALGHSNTFELSPEQLRNLERRLLNENYTISFRLDGPLAGENSLFAWDAGMGPSSHGRPPRLLLNAGPTPQIPISTGTRPPTNTPTPSTTPTPSITPTPTDTPEWIVITSTPTPANALTAAAIAVQETVWATTTGTATATPEFVATATPSFIVITNTPTPANYATVVYQRILSTANVLLTGTPTPTPHNLATATSTPRPTRTPVLIWLDEITGTPTPTVTPTPTTPPMPGILHGKIAFLSDRGETTKVYVLDPDSGRVALLTDRWPYDLALETERTAPDGQRWAFVQNDHRGIAQIYIYSLHYGMSWQITFTSDISYHPVWSPVADQLAFVSMDSGNDEIYSIDIDGQNQKQLSVNSWEWDKHPSWSPDGAQIIFWSNADTGRRQLWIMNADGSNRRILLDSPYNDWDPVWIK